MIKKNGSFPTTGPVLSGFSVSDGIAIGPACLIRVDRVRPAMRTIEPDQVAAEIARFKAAVRDVDEYLDALKDNLSGRNDTAAEEMALLLDAHRAMLASRRFVAGVEDRIAREGLAAESALVAVLDDIEKQFSAIKDGYLASRYEDVAALGQRLLRVLMDLPWVLPSEVPAGSVILAEELSPADTAALDLARLCGFVTVRGGVAGHTAILARSAGLPAVLGVAGILEVARNGATVIVDAVEGRVLIDPAPETLAEYRARVAMLGKEKDSLKALSGLPAVTKDGVRLTLQANVESPRDIRALLGAGAEGIGLFRTEFMFMGRPNLPSEDEQAETMIEVVRAMGGRPVTFRTLDIGGDKLAPVLGSQMSSGANPALGLRAVRFSLARPDFFRAQVRAILRAGAAGHVRILLPMVTTVDEVTAARRLIGECHAALKAEKISCAAEIPPVGVMIEIPAAALAADQLAMTADFLSLGTNDLIQYTMAIDRGNDQVAFLYDPLNPAVLRLIEFTIQAAARAGIPVGICGEMASNPAFIPLLAGLGLRDLSLGYAWIPAVKRAIREIRLDDAQKLAQRVMDSYNPADVRRLVYDRKG